jgi:para-nitrobenzyl esterase
MRFLLLLILVLCSIGTKTFAAGGPVAHTPNGDVEGTDQGAVESFKGLPYAKPPLADLRWKPPQDPANWSGDGTKFSSPCPQSPDMNGNFIGSEDCLYLNVFRPKGAQDLPVMMFIHGGHNEIDSASPLTLGEKTPWDGSDLAQNGNNGNVVVVTINYRLGALGFIAHPKLSKESGYDGSGNYGYMDQIQALKWVSRNIAAFGGNPNNITVFGQSNGGGSVLILMTSPLSQGLFHKAISHSGVFDSQSLDDGENVGITVSEKIGCRTAPDELKCMRDAPVKDILKADPKPGKFDPVIDRHVLLDSPIKLIQDGKYQHMPVLIGNVVEEVSWLKWKKSKDLHTEKDYIDQVKQIYTPPAADGILKHYRTKDYPPELVPYWADEKGLLRRRFTPQPSPRRAYNAILTDVRFLCPARTVLRALSAHQSEFVGRFLYTHTLEGPPTTHRMDGLALTFFGASHAFDSIVLFGSFDVYDLTPTLDEKILKASFQKTWADFARSGFPGVFWNRYDASRDNYVMFNKPMSGGSQLSKEQCRFWDHHPKFAKEVLDAS